MRGSCSQAACVAATWWRQTASRADPQLHSPISVPSSTRMETACVAPSRTNACSMRADSCRSWTAPALTSQTPATNSAELAWRRKVNLAINVTRVCSAPVTETPSAASPRRRTDFTSAPAPMRREHEATSRLGSRSLDSRRHLRERPRRLLCVLPRASGDTADMVVIVARSTVLAGRSRPAECRHRTIEPPDRSAQT